MGKLKVLVATGGTGGHLFPAKQLTELMPDAESVFAGHLLEKTPFFDRKVPYYEIPSSNRNPLILLTGLFRSFRLLWRFKPDVVVGFGSFHSFPVLLAAVLLRKKIVLFEANCSVGKVNRLFMPFAKKVAFQFPLKDKKAAYVPLLPWIGKQTTMLSAAEARKSYGLDPDVFTILVFGGSQGAIFINKTFCAAAKLLQRPFQVIHFTGKEDSEIKYEVPCVVLPFEKEMAKAYAAADLVVCRCGAGTTAELIRFQKPAILIPYPYAYDHQRKNGEFLKLGARVLLQATATPDILAQEIERMRDKLASYKEALQRIELPQTVDFGALVRAVGEKR
jgi:UDP-N-acetylglucosamine--N-acetylmuramyl-(pentapeptide) pyrophosphoryl-undecaprenol N-acetylglucosamine transferase